MRALFVFVFMFPFSIALGQSDNPYTWLRVFGYPVFNGSVKEVFIKEVLINPETYEFISTINETRYIFDEGNLPTTVYKITYSEGSIADIGDIIEESTEYIYYNDRNILSNTEQATKTPFINGGQAFYLNTTYESKDNFLVVTTLDDNDDESYTREYYTFYDESFEIRGTSNSNLKENFFQSIFTFDNLWESFGKEVSIELDGEPQKFSSTQTDEMGLSSVTDNVTGKSLTNTYERDEQGNPTLAFKAEESYTTGDKTGLALIYEYIYR